MLIILSNLIETPPITIKRFSSAANERSANAINKSVSGLAAKTCENLQYEALDVFQLTRHIFRYILERKKKRLTRVLGPTPKYILWVCVEKQ